MARYRGRENTGHREREQEGLDVAKAGLVLASYGLVFSRWVHQSSGVARRIIGFKNMLYDVNRFRGRIR